MKKNLRAIGLAGSFFLILGLTFFGQPLLVSDTLAAEKVLMRLNWKVSGTHVPYIVALDQGYYKEEGLDVTVKEGAGSTAVVKLISTGKETFGMVGTNVLVKAIARGMPIKQIGVMETSKQQGVISKAEAPIRTPQDFIGKTIAGSGAGTSDMFNAFLAANNIPLDKVKYLSAGRARLEAFASGRSDGLLGLGLADPVRLLGMGVKNPHVLIFGRWGVPEVGDGIVTHLDVIKKNPEMIRGFVKAFLRGVNYTYMDVERAASIAVKHFPMAKKEILVNHLESLKWLYPPPIGWQDPKVIKDLIKMTADFAGIPQVVDMHPSKFYTNEFIPKY